MAGRRVLQNRINQFNPFLLFTLISGLFILVSVSLVPWVFLNPVIICLSDITKTGSFFFASDSSTAAMPRTYDCFIRQRKKFVSNPLHQFFLIAAGKIGSSNRTGKEYVSAEKILVDIQSCPAWRMTRDLEYPKTVTADDGLSFGKINCISSPGEILSYHKRTVTLGL